MLDAEKSHTKSAQKPRKRKKPQSSARPSREDSPEATTKRKRKSKHKLSSGLQSVENQLETEGTKGEAEVKSAGATNQEPESQRVSNQEGRSQDADAKPPRKRRRKRKDAPSREVANERDESNAPHDGGRGERTARKLPKATQETEDTIRSSEDAVKHEIYVEGLSFDVAEDDVKAFFAPSGDVVEVRLPRYQDSGKPKGYCHVRFRTSEAVGRALKQDGAHMMGRYLKVEQARVSRVLQHALKGERPVRPKGCRSVFVKNLPYETSEDEVRNVFMVCGKVQDVRLARHNRTGNMKGFGYVDFVTETAAEVAVNKANIRVGGRVVLVDYEQGRPKGSFRREDGRFWKAPNSKAAKRKVVPE